MTDNPGLETERSLTSYNRPVFFLFMSIYNSESLLFFKTSASYNTMSVMSFEHFELFESKIRISFSKHDKTFPVAVIETQVNLMPVCYI